MRARWRFDVLVDGKLIASRTPSLFNRIFRGVGWPDEESVVAEIGRRLKAGRE